MTVIASHITVTTTAQRIVDTDNVRRDVLLHAKQACHIGGEGVTFGNGYLMDNGDEIRLTVFEGDTLWAVTEAGTGDLYVIISAQI